MHWRRVGGKGGERNAAQHKYHAIVATKNRLFKCLTGEKIVATDPFAYSNWQINIVLCVHEAIVYGSNCLPSRNKLSHIEVRGIKKRCNKICHENPI